MGGQLAQRPHRRRHGDLSAELAEDGGERVTDRLRSAAGARPAECMAGEQEHEGEGGGSGLLEWHRGVRTAAGEERTRRRSRESRVRDGATGTQREGSEAGHQQRVRGNPHRAQDVGEEPLHARDQRPHQVRVGRTVAPQTTSRCGDGSLEQGDLAARQRVGERQGWLDPRDPEPFQVERPEERRRDAERMNGGAHVVVEPGKRQLLGPGPPADAVRRFHDQDRSPGPREGHGCGQTVRTRADDDRVEVHPASTPRCRPVARQPALDGDGALRRRGTYSVLVPPACRQPSDERPPVGIRRDTSAGPGRRLRRRPEMSRSSSPTIATPSRCGSVTGSSSSPTCARSTSRSAATRRAICCGTTPTSRRRCCRISAIARW